MDWTVTQELLTPQDLGHYNQHPPWVDRRSGLLGILDQCFRCKHPSPIHSWLSVAEQRWSI